MTSWTFPVEAGHVTMFARAIGDPNPAFEPPSAETAITAVPPTFAIAAAQFQPGYPMRPTPGQPWFGSASTPGTPRRALGNSEDTGESKGTGFHAEEHFEYLAPVRPGQRLSARTDWGRTWHKQGSRGGRLTFIEKITEFRDEGGTLVIRERSVYVRTERTVGDEERG